MTARWRKSALNHGAAQPRHSDAPGIGRHRRDSRGCGNTCRAAYGGAREKMRRYVGRLAEATTLTSVVHREPGMTNEDFMERAIDLAPELHALQPGRAVRSRDRAQRRHRRRAATRSPRPGM